MGYSDILEIPHFVDSLDAFPQGNRFVCADKQS